MAKKFGKLLLFSAAIGSAVAAAYYFVQKKAGVHEMEEDYDDFSEETDETQESRNYVSLNPDDAAENAEKKSGEDAAPAEEAPEKEKAFTPLTEQVTQASANTEESVEEFFDEEDSTDEEPPISES